MIKNSKIKPIKLKQLTSIIELLLIEQQSHHDKIDSLETVGLNVDFEHSLWQTPITSMIQTIAFLLSNKLKIQNFIIDDINWFLYDKPKGPSKVTFTNKTDMLVDDTAKGLANLLMYQTINNYK